MKKKFLALYGTVVLISLAGCTASRSSGQLPGTGGTQPPVQQTPVETTAPTLAATQPAAAVPEATTPAVTTPATESPTSTALTINPDLATRLSNTCDLLNSKDLAGILVTGETHGELVKQPINTQQVDHPVFSKQNIPTTEVNCVYYEFFNPGKTTGEMLQVTYWLDLPGQGVSATTWQKAWTDAANAGQPVSDIGEQAYTTGSGKLTFEQDNLYFTLEIVDTSRSAQQIDQIAQQVAADMLKNLAGMQ